MECKVYGHAGRPILYIPCQDGRFFDFEDFHMADTLAPWIDSGKVMVLSKMCIRDRYIPRSGESSCSPLLQPSVNYKPEQQMPTGL